MVLSWLSNVMGRPTAGSASARRVRRRFRPSVEVEVLEDRLVPATTGTFVWTGAANNDWNNANNWNRVAGEGTYPGAPNSNLDEADFDNNAGKACNLNINVDIGTVKLAANFAQTLTLQAGKSMLVRGSGFEMFGGTLNLANGATLSLKGGLTTNWTGGDLSSTSAGGTIYVYGNAELLVQGNAQKLGASVVVGQDSGGAASKGILDLGTNRGGDLNNNLTLYNNATITVYQQGTLNFYQTANSDTKGGIAVSAPNSTSKIDNYGTINRTTLDTGNKMLKVVPPVRSLDANATLNVGKNCQIEFTGKYDLQQGIFKKAAGSRIKGLVGDGGKVSIEDGGVAGRYDTYFDDDLIMNAGILSFDNTTPGAYGTLHVAGNFQLGAGVTVSLNVDGSTAENSDGFQVDGLTTINGAILNVNTQNASPLPGWTYTFISSTGGMSGTGWASNPNNFGYAADYIFSNPFQLEEI